jgi:predicted nucleotidyltransferase
MGHSSRPRKGGELADRQSEILDALRRQEKRLRHVGVQSLYVFGSMVRGEARPNSDLDLAMDARPGRKYDMFDYAAILGEIERIVGQPVDLARRDRLKPHVAEAAGRDMIRVF